MSPWNNEVFEFDLMNEPMKFNRIVAVDDIGLVEQAIHELGQYSIADVDVWKDCPRSDDELVSRISNAECVLVSWNTDIGANVIDRCPNLKYIGLCCSLYNDSSCNVDVGFARTKGICITGVRDYGDEGLVEFVLSELIRLCKGTGKHQWRSEPVELTDKVLGVIGLGRTGAKLAKRAQAFGMRCIYFSRTRKSEIEDQGVEYRSLDRLLLESEIVSLHLPRHSNVLGPQEFNVLGNGKILVNTSLGLVFDKHSFCQWIGLPGNFGIFDGDGIGANFDEFSKLERVITTEKVSGWTREARRRLSDGVIANIDRFLRGEETG